MTGIGPTRSGGDPAAARAAPRHGDRTAVEPDDARAMHGAFARAGRPAPSKALLHDQRGAARAAERDAPEPFPAPAAAPPVRSPGQDRREGLARDHRGSDHPTPEAATILPATAPPPPATIAAPAMLPPQVDPAAFAQLLARLWLEERGKGGQEVRVSFGADAWPATEARVVRGAAGTLDIRLRLARSGAADGALGHDLARHLAASGLAVGAVRVVG